MWGASHDVPLPHVMTDAIEHNGQTYRVLSSAVSLEIENAHHEFLTVRRSISGDESRSLISTWSGPALSNPSASYKQTDFYVRQKGAASNPAGFHRHLADFIGWNLPHVAKFTGEKTLLYMECIFPLLFVEQKRGWSTIQTRFPTQFGIREVSRRTLEFLLSLDVSNIELERQQIRDEENEVKAQWSAAQVQLERNASIINATTKGISKTPTTNWPPETEPIILTLQDDLWVPLNETISKKREELHQLTEITIPSTGEVTSETQIKLNHEETRLAEREVAARQALAEFEAERMETSSLKSRLEALEEDLQRNNDAIRLKNLGSTQRLSLYENTCPTCQQPVSDSLLSQDFREKFLPLEENIRFLKEQKQIASLALSEAESRFQNKRLQLESARAELNELRSSIRALRSTLLADQRAPSIAEVEKRVRLEEQIRRMQKSAENFDIDLVQFEKLADQWSKIQERKSRLPSETLSGRDHTKLNRLETTFKSLLREFGLTSISPNSVYISPDYYRPMHEGLDLQFDLSASDTVRTIWAYLLSMLELSRTDDTNHPGLLIFDEPGQQSVALDSLGNFLRRASDSSDYAQQVIVATSESPDNIARMLANQDYTYLEFEDRIIRPLSG
jgi:hypothetical protein